MPRSRPSTTGFAILGLIAVQSGSAYELAKRMERNYRFFWPRAESKLYAETKELVAMGAANAESQATGRRPRTVYSITPAGRTMLAEWVASPVEAGPSLAFEALLRVTYADCADRDVLLAHLDEVHAEATRILAMGAVLGRLYADGQVELPQRAHTNVLVWRFLHAHWTAIAEWSAWARAEVATWKDTSSSPENLARARALFAQHVGP